MTENTPYLIEVTLEGKKNLSNRDAYFLNHIAQEIIFARGKFPGTKHMVAVFLEEAGELAKSLLDYEDDKIHPYEIWLEAVQSAAMAMRIGVEGVSGMRYGELTKELNS
jgi:hypothetical protein